MKKIILLVITLLITSNSFGQSPFIPPGSEQIFTNDGNCTFSWKHSDSPFVIGYYVYITYIDIPEKTGYKFDVNYQNEFTFINCAEGKMMVYITAYDQYRNESKPTNVLDFNKSYEKPPPPSELTGKGNK